MSAYTPENHGPADPGDRLLEIGLAELVGGAAPPDLSTRIAAASTMRPTPVVAQGRKKREGRAFWVQLAVAVMLMIGVTIALVPRLHNARSTVAILSSSNSLSTAHAGDPKLPSPWYLSDDVAATAPKFDRLGGPVGAPAQTPAPTIAFEFSGRGEGASPWKYLWAAPNESQLYRGQEKLEWRYSSENVAGQANQNSYGAAPGAVTPGQPTSTSNGTVIVHDGSDPATLAYSGAPAPADREFYFDSGSPADAEKQVPLSNENAVAGKQLLKTYGGERRKDRYGSLDLHSRRTVAKGRDSLGRDTNAQVADLMNTVEGVGPDLSGDKYTRIVENPFIKADGGAAVSTFSIDVDTASYANVRQFLKDMNQLPPPDAVRIEELVNYFQYDYTAPKPTDETPFAAHVELTACPWAPEHRLARIGIKGRELDRSKRPQSNLVFLVDVSGSMDEPNKLPLVVYGLEKLTRELGENDRVAIVVYASSEGLVLPSTPGTKQETILGALSRLKAGGSTAGGAGIQLAYQLAEDNFIKGGTNRVILCTDGDFNVGVTSTAELERMVEKKAKDTGVFLSVLGFGRGNLNETMMEAIANHGNGNYHYVDSRKESRRVLVEQMTGTLITIAKDVKIQVEFNPANVAGYRLIGYEDRMLRTEDFNDDKKDAGEIGAGHTVTALYEIVPAGKKVEVGAVDELKYQKPVGRTILSVENESGNAKEPTDKIVRPTADPSKELLTLKMRYKAPDGDTSKKLEWPVTDDGKAFAAASGDTKFAAAVAAFGLMLRNSQYKGNLTYAAVIELAQSGIGDDTHGYRKEFVEMVRKAKELKHE
jgi:Ca-activated chloride channel family protein